MTADPLDLDAVRASLEAEADGSVGFTSWDHAMGTIVLLLAEVRRLRSALVGCWDEYEELMPDRLREQVKAALGYVEFVGTISATVESETLRALLGGDDG